MGGRVGGGLAGWLIGWRADWRAGGRDRLCVWHSVIGIRPTLEKVLDQSHLVVYRVAVQQCPAIIELDLDVATEMKELPNILFKTRPRLNGKPCAR
jgi:hypothetical protein